MFAPTSDHTGPVTLINVFIVEPGDQNTLIDSLKRANEVTCLAPGFVSARIHRSLDGTRVAVCAHWRSLEDYQAMCERPTVAAAPQGEPALRLFEPGVYEVVQSYA